ncbi:MAG TPA: glycosyltransferase family 4 protein [Candidatus Dormibacteraeota bacterium]|jgi:glycosyltransferase involved in cell wall biosynthesis|nr:glycosyltransferase family 4 protein [Candidatus Dormibacteraeota bacterium]
MARIALVHEIAGIAAVQAELLRKEGHEVDQIALPALGASWRWPAKWLALPVRLAAYLPVVWRLRRDRYDIVHIHFLSQGVVGVLSGQPFYAQAHGSDLHVNLNSPIYRWVTRSVLEKATAVFYVTPNLSGYFDEYHSKLLYLPNPVDVKGLEDGVPVPTEVKRVLIFTRLHPVKGVDRIFPAVERLSSQFELTALEYGPLAREYMARYGRWVKFAKPIPHDQIGRFVTRFDLVIGQMRQGILSLMEIEAMIAGRPVVTALDWNLYRDDPPPVVAASGPNAIVAAIEKLKNDSQELARLSREGREWAIRNHSHAHHLQLLRSAYFGDNGSRTDVAGVDTGTPEAPGA